MGSRSKLTPKQSAFVKAYLSNGHNAAAAYRTAYATKAASDTTVASEAFRLLKHPLIAPIIEADHQRREAALERISVTKEWMVEKLGLLFNSAFDRDDASAASKVGMLLGKMQGYITEKRETRIIKSLEDLTNEELAAMVAEDEQRERDTRH